MAASLPRCLLCGQYNWAGRLRRTPALAGKGWSRRDQALRPIVDHPWRLWASLRCGKNDHPSPPTLDFSGPTVRASFVDFWWVARKCDPQTCRRSPADLSALRAHYGSLRGQSPCRRPPADLSALCSFAAQLRALREGA